MVLEWFKRLFSEKEAQQEEGVSLEDIATSVVELQSTVSEMNSSLQKGLRRLSLAQKQQTDSIESLAQESQSLAFNITDRYGKALTYGQVLNIMDHLDKIGHAVDHTGYNSDVINALRFQAAAELVSLFELKEIAHIRQPYPSHGCEVVGAVDEPLYPEGTVHQILQQGYQTTNGQLVRAAKVIVCRRHQ